MATERMDEAQLHEIERDAKEGPQTLSALRLQEVCAEARRARAAEEDLHRHLDEARQRVNVLEAAALQPNDSVGERTALRAEMVSIAIRRLDEAREALRPFAELVPDSDNWAIPKYDDDVRIMPGPMRVGDLRRARRVVDGGED